MYHLNPITHKTPFLDFSEKVYINFSGFEEVKEKANYEELSKVLGAKIEYSERTTHIICKDGKAKKLL